MWQRRPDSTVGHAVAASADCAVDFEMGPDSPATRAGRVPTVATLAAGNPPVYISDGIEGCCYEGYNISLWGGTSEY